jgi:hypothetical protein
MDWLVKTGYAERAPTPVTAGRNSSGSPLRPSSRPADPPGRQKEHAGRLAHWHPQELHQFTTSFHRILDDFLAYATEHEPGQPNERRSSDSARPCRAHGQPRLPFISAGVGASLETSADHAM